MRRGVISIFLIRGARERVILSAADAKDLLSRGSPR